MVHIHCLGIKIRPTNPYTTSHYSLHTVDPDQAPQQVGVQRAGRHGLRHTPAPTNSWPSVTRIRLIVNNRHIWARSISDAGLPGNLCRCTAIPIHALEYRHGRVYGHDSRPANVVVSLELMPSITT